jgi:vesicle-associated membrane protein 7
MPGDGILYAMIAGIDNSTLAEVVREKGSHAVNAKRVLQTIPRGSTGKRCIGNNDLHYNIIGDGTMIYLCVTHDQFSRLTAFNFLNAVKSNCGGGKLKNPQEMHQQLKRDVDFYSDPKNDKITKIRTDIAEVKEVMVDNIDKILERGDKIDNLVSKTENLEFESRRFESRSNDLKWKMWKKRIIITAIVILVITVVIFIIVLIACSKDGVNFKKCGQKEE